MYKFSVKNDRGEVLSLTQNPDYTVYKIEGLTPPQAAINDSVNTTMDGSTVNSVRLEKRNIVIYLALERDIEKNRINLYKYFPPKKTVTLFFSNDTRDVRIDGRVELIECDPFANKQVAQISIVCPKPYFKSVDDLVTSFGDNAALFEFPFSIPASGMEFSAITTNARKSIINTGDEESGIIIELFAAGTVVNPIIYDVFNRTHMQLNFTMEPSDKIVINTNVGSKSITLIRAGVSSNLLGHMVKDSKWFVLAAGDNIFTYDCESGGSNLQITFTTTMLYMGV